MSEITLKDSYSTAKKAFRLGTYLRNHHKFYSQGDRMPIWMYNEQKGIWIDTGVNFIQNFLAHYLGSMYKKNLVNEVLSYIRYTSYDDGVILGGPTNKIVMANGTFNLDTYTFDPRFNADEYHISGIPINYDPDAKCPNIDQFLIEILMKTDLDGNILNDDETNIRAMTEFFGYCLLKDYPYAIVLMLLGGGANGKSTLLEILRKFVGPENCSACTPQQLAENRFKMAQLRGRLVNIAGDIPAKPLEYTGTIKMVTGGDQINAEHKNQDSFDFINHAKMIFSANQLPRAYDTTDAFHRRIRIIDFPNIFASDDPTTKSKDKLLSTLTTPEELSGLFLKAVGGLRKLETAGHLTGEQTALEKRIAYVQRSDAIEYMVLKYIFHDPMGTPITKETLFDLYIQLSTALKMLPTSDAWFGKLLRRHLPYIESKQLAIGPGGKKIWCWVGIGTYTDELLQEIEHLNRISGRTGNSGILGFQQNKRDLYIKGEELIEGKPKNTRITQVTQDESETDEVFESSDRE